MHFHIINKMKQLRYTFKKKVKNGWNQKHYSRINPYSLCFLKKIYLAIKPKMREIIKTQKGYSSKYRNSSVNNRTQQPIFSFQLHIENS